MEPVENGKAAMIAGIEADARKEEEKILAEAEAQAAEKRKYGDKKIESLLNDARDKAQAQADALKAKAISEVELDIKRRHLHDRDTLMRDILNRVEQTLVTCIDDPGYRSVLRHWITEAALGLDAESAHVNASAQERPLISDSLLAEVTEDIRARTGKQITLTLSDSPPLAYQGVVLTASDGRMAFNNQVRTRMSRKQGEIQKVIYNTLFPKESL
jgi:vacuolar-type H+-ATPase subunit E/Vma4